MKEAFQCSLVVVVLLSTCGCGGKDEAARVAAASPDTTVSAGDLIKAYADDFGAADEKYKGRVIVVDGFVEYVTDDAELATIRLDGDAAEATDLEATVVSCVFEDGADMPDVKVGDRIKIKGLCEGRIPGLISLGYCVTAD